MPCALQVPGPGCAICAAPEHPDPGVETVGGPRISKPRADFAPQPPPSLALRILGAHPNLKPTLQLDVVPGCFAVTMLLQQGETGRICWTRSCIPSSCHFCPHPRHARTCLLLTYVPTPHFAWNVAILGHMDCRRPAWMNKTSGCGPRRSTSRRTGRRMRTRR